MIFKTAATAFLIGLMATGKVLAAEPPTFDPLYRFDRTTYGAIGTLQFGSDGRLYSYTNTLQRVIWSITPSKTAPDLKFVDNPSLPEQPGQSPGPIAIHTGSAVLVRDAQGNIFKGAFPNNRSGTPSAACPYSGQDTSTDPATPIVNYGFIARFGPNLPSVEKVSQSAALPICPTQSLAIDTSVTPNMLYFISEIGAGSNVPTAAVGKRIYKMPADNSEVPQLVHEFATDDFRSGASAGFLQLIVSQDGQWLYGVTGGGPVAAQSYLYRIGTDGTSYQKLEKFTADTGHPFLDSPSLMELGDYLYLGAFSTTNRSSRLLRVPKDFTADSELQILHAFNGTDGNRPLSLTLASDGNIYGITFEGGSANAGTVFRIRPADVPLSGQGGVDANIYSFSGNAEADGANPTDLINGPDGKLYGVVPTNGVVYALDIGYVPPAPIFRSFNGTPAQVEWRHGGAASSVTLSWNVENAQNCQLEGPGLATTPVAFEDSTEVTPANEGSNIYRLTCDNGSGLPSGTASATFQVNAVAPPPPPIISTFSVTPAEVSPLGTVRFGWATQDAQTCRGSWAGNPLPAEQLSSGWADYAVTRGSEGTQTFTLTCTGRGGDTVTAEVILTVRAGASGDGGESSSIEVSDSGGPVTPWLLLPLSLLALCRRPRLRQH